jgi:hypothetical protein
MRRKIKKNHEPHKPHERSGFHKVLREKKKEGKPLTTQTKERKIRKI